MSLYTTDKLLAKIKRRGMIPTSQRTFTQQDLIDFCNEEMIDRLVPNVLEVREEYFVFTQDIPIVANESHYRIPSRAAGGRLRDVKLVHQTGDVDHLPRAEPNSEWTIDFGSTTGTPKAYFLESNYVVIVPTPPSTGGYVRMSYHMRPNELILPEKAGTIVSIDTVAGSFDVEGPNSGWDALKVYDVLKGSPGFEMVAIDLVATDFQIIGTGAYRFTFDAEDLKLSGLEVGDYICLKGQSPVPQIPADLHDILAQRVVIKVLEALGDDAGLDRARKQLQEMEFKSLALIAGRVDGARRYVTSMTRGI